MIINDFMKNSRFETSKTAISTRYKSDGVTKAHPATKSRLVVGRAGSLLTTVLYIVTG